jgi:hypothetical protein
MWQMLRQDLANPSNKRSFLASAPAEIYRSCPDLLVHIKKASRRIGEASEASGA